MTIAELTSQIDAIERRLGAGEPLRPETPVEDGRIMVVDDDATATMLMQRLLEREGFSRVVTAGDGERALDLLVDYPADVVVLDVHLPRVDGVDVLREIRRRDERDDRTTGVLAVSGDVTSATCRTMLWAGADDFVSRPFDNAEFMLRVRRLAARTRALGRALAHVRWLECRVRDLSRD